MSFLPTLYPSPTVYPSPTLYPTFAPGPFTLNIFNSFAPWLAYDQNGNLAEYLFTLGSMYDLVAEIVVDQNSLGDSDYVPGWSILLDPNNCPTQFLPFLAQFVGVSLPQGTSDGYARAQIKAESNQKRGTVGAILWAVQQNLSGGNGAVTNYGTFAQFLATPASSVPQGSWFVVTDQKILFQEVGVGSSATWQLNAQLVEREGLAGPDAYHFIIIVNPADLLSAATLTAMVNARKPGGLQWSLVQTSGWTWSQAINQWQADTMTWAQTADGTLAHRP